MSRTRAELAKRAAFRHAAEIHRSLQSGDWLLSTVATTAPMLGVLAALDAFLGSFPGFAGERSAIFAAVVRRLANTLSIAAAGLIPALIAYWGLAWSQTVDDRMASDMDAAVADLYVCLSRLED